MSGKKLGGFLFGIVGVLAGIIIFLLMQSDTPKLQVAESNEAADGTVMVDSVVNMPATERLTGSVQGQTSIELPDSLSGTEVDGGFRVGDDGHLIVDKSIKRFMDYFLGTVGEMSVDQIVANMESMIGGSLQEPARSEAMAILKGYIEYKQALYELEQQLGDVNLMDFSADHLSEMSERLRIVRETRRSFLGEDVSQAFYAEEEAVDRFTLQKLTVMNDESLSEDEKQAQVAELAQTMLPEKIRKQREETTVHERLQSEEAKLKEEGASPEEIYAVRSEMVGDEAAQRLAALDAKRENFKKRLREYREEKVALDQTSMENRDKSEALQRLRQSYFSELEIRRVAALDRLGLE